MLESAGVPVKPTSITALQRDCGLQDVYEYQHELRGDTTNKKQHKIDHLLISPALLPAVIRSGFLPFGEILESNHRTGFADFDSTVLFGEEIPDLTNTANRKLHTKYPKRMAKYSTEVKLEFERRGIFQSLANLRSRFKKNRSHRQSHKKVQRDRQRGNTNNAKGRGQLRQHLPFHHPLE